MGPSDSVGVGVTESLSQRWSGSAAQVIAVGDVVVSARPLLALGQRRVELAAEAPAGDDQATDLELLDLLAARGRGAVGTS